MCVYCQIAPLKAVVGVDRPMKVPSMHLQTPFWENCLSSHCCHFVQELFFLN